VHIRITKLENFSSYAEMVARKLQQKIDELDDSD
jgi:hypothetical protein